MQLIKVAAASLPLLSAWPRLRCGSTCHRATGRHSHGWNIALYQFAAGVDLRTVAGRLGHGSGGATTLRIYAVWVDEADHRAADTIARLVPRPDPSKRDPRSPYEKIAAELRQAIVTGELQPGDQLPTVTDLAATHGVSAGTAHRAIDLLRSEGAIAVSRGRRAQVPTQAPSIRQPAD